VCDLSLAPSSAPFSDCPGGSLRPMHNLLGGGSCTRSMPANMARVLMLRECPQGLARCIPVRITAMLVVPLALCAQEACQTAGKLDQMPCALFLLVRGVHTPLLLAWCLHKRCARGLAGFGSPLCVLLLAVHNRLLTVLALAVLCVVLQRCATRQSAGWFWQVCRVSTSRLGSPLDCCCYSCVHWQCCPVLQHVPEGLQGLAAV
jgi:hypothetical protein